MIKNQKESCSSTNRGIFHLTRNVDYAIYLLSEVGKSKDPISLNTIAEEHHLSFSLLQKVAALLRKKKLITSIRGKYGGYELAKDPKEINLNHIIEAVEGPIKVMDCLGKSGNCKRMKTCGIRPKFQKINDEIVNSVTSKTLDLFM